MRLNIQCLSNIDSSLVEVPQPSIFTLPEKVMQFGTGVLLRGLTDFYIDKANKNGVFNGRIVIVKSTNSGTTDSFALQDNLYTVIVKGVESGVPVNKKIINASISRVLNANESWNEVLLFATDSQLKIIISNTTEVGISLLNESIFSDPPTSFPAKLLAVLWKRYQYYKADVAMGLVIIPTELISENGTLLKKIIIELALFNKLGTDFLKWLDEANDFCNSLVDRIVPGKLVPNKKEPEETLLGYTDDLMLLCEPYSLWAIESKKKRTQEILSFVACNPTVKVENDINHYKELKLRLLNGTHSFSCALALFCGFETVKDAMQTDYFRYYVKKLMLEEIKPLILSESISEKSAKKFAEQVIDRFSNDAIEHKWINISLQYSSKMIIRNIPLILKNYDSQNLLPKCMILGFAAYLIFMKTKKGTNGLYEATIGNKSYQVVDEKAEILYQHWHDNNIQDAVLSILSDKELWGTDLSLLKGFSKLIIDSVLSLQNGAENILRSLMKENFQNAE